MVACQMEVCQDGVGEKGGGCVNMELGRMG